MKKGSPRRDSVLPITIKCEIIGTEVVAKHVTGGFNAVGMFCR